MLRGEEDPLASQSFFAGITGPDAQCLDAAFDFGNGRMHGKIWSTTQLWNSVWGNTFVLSSAVQRLQCHRAVFYVLI